MFGRQNAGGSWSADCRWGWLFWVTVIRKERSGGSKPTALAVGFGRNAVSVGTAAAQCARHTGWNAPCFQASRGRRSQTVGLGRSAAEMLAGGAMEAGRRSGVCTACCRVGSACLVGVLGVVSGNTLYTRNGDGRTEWNWPQVPERNRGTGAGMRRPGKTCRMMLS